MSSDRRWRFRFSLRSAAVLTGVLCLILASWHWTVKDGVDAMQDKFGSGRPIVVVAPFVLARDSEEPDPMGHVIDTYRTYYVWYGLETDALPFARKVSSRPAPGVKSMYEIKSYMPTGQPATLPP